MAKHLLSIAQLGPGKQYVVQKSFRDFYNNFLAAGEVLTFVKHNFVPYHGGHTIVFRERVVYLQEDANVEILDDLDSYLAEA